MLRPFLYALFTGLRGRGILRIWDIGCCMASVLCSRACYIVAVTPFGLNGVCADAGYAQRVDLPGVLH
jgi:hypothetical protein